MKFLSDTSRLLVRDPRRALRYLSLTFPILLTLALFGGLARPQRPSVFWGAWIDGSSYGAGYGGSPWDGRTTRLFEQHAGKAVSIIHIAKPWYYGVYQDFPAGALDLIRSHGAIPMLDWGSWNVEHQRSDAAYTLASIYSGNFDSYISSWAAAAKAWGKPFFLRFDWEMNGNWFVWSEQQSGNQPGNFVKMWRHVHDIFVAKGATNVTWVWCPTAAYRGSTQIASLYPGDAYVDWTCFDAYNQNQPWIAPSTLYDPTYQQLLRVAPTKPIMVGETASTETGGSKAKWIQQLFAALPVKFPRIKALVWFNWADGGSDWPIETSPAAQRAFAKGIADRRYDSNRYRSITRSPIPAP